MTVSLEALRAEEPDTVGFGECFNMAVTPIGLSEFDEVRLKIGEFHVRRSPVRKTSLSRLTAASCANPAGVRSQPVRSTITAPVFITRTKDFMIGAREIVAPISPAQGNGIPRNKGTGRYFV